MPVFALVKMASLASETDDVFDLLFDAVGFGRREINFIENGQKFEIVFDG